MYSQIISGYMDYLWLVSLTWIKQHKNPVYKIPEHMYKLKSDFIKDTHIVKRKGKLFLYCIAGNPKRKMELLILISSAFDSWAEKLSHINWLLAGKIDWAKLIPCNM